MKNAFRFKQFVVYQDLAAMKVGTDGVLLGAWTDFNNVKSILDIGTGTGLIALMAAQKNLSAQITAIEIDEQAYRQAVYNFKISPWKNRLKIFHTALQNYNPSQKFDLIVTNPPYFNETVQAKNKARQLARNTKMLNLKDLLFYSNRLLRKEGKIFLILPKNKEAELLKIAQLEGFYPDQMVDVKGTKNSLVKRILVSLIRQPVTCKRSELIIEVARHQYTEDYICLTKDFYLKLN